MIKLIADCGLPLKIQTEWTETTYQDYDEFDYMTTATVKGWRVRINGKIYPRGNVKGDGSADWSYRYTPKAGQTEEGKKEAIRNALLEAGLKVKDFKTNWRMI